MYAWNLLLIISFLPAILYCAQPHSVLLALQTNNSFDRSASSPVEVSVNGAGGVVELESTGVYENWVYSAPIQISLNQGSNSIQLKHTSGM